MTTWALSDAVLRPIRGRHAFEACVEQLGTAIRIGLLADGSSLPAERELAERLAVSRATLREAIAALRAAGMVRTARGRGGGTVVSYRPGVPGAAGRAGLAPRRAELLDSLTFRRIVEPGACRVAAATTLSGAERRLLTDALDDATAAEDPARHRQADSRLHLAIAGVAGSPLILEAVSSVQASLHEMLIAIPVLDRNIAHSRAQHESIVHAILDGAAATAHRLMEHHCDDTAALLRGLLD